MSREDNNGRTYAFADTVKAGDVLECDGGFTCMKCGEHKIVKAIEGPLPHCSEEYAKDPFARLFIDCEDGKHMLDGQVGDDMELVGLYPIK